MSITEICPRTGRACPYRLALGNYILPRTVSDIPAIQLEFEEERDKEVEEVLSLSEHSCEEEVCGIAVAGAAIAIRHAASGTATAKIQDKYER